MDNKILVTNIQRFSLHDGPGIRTTVFLKGCALQCPWCANPENISKLPQSYTKDGETGMYGKYMSPQQLFDELMRDRMFFCDGGVTFSGGEPLLQMSVLEPVLRLLKENHIHICMETSLFAPSAQLEIALKYVDLFYVDCKLADPKGWQTVLRGDLTQYLKNIHRLFQTNIPRIFRIPIIGGYTDTEEAMTQILDLIDTYRPDSVELLIGHNLGAKKYVSLGLTPPVISDVQPEFLEQYLKHLQQKEICAKICRI